MASLTRDMIQGFIDGYITQGGSLAGLSLAVQTYLANHPIYPTDAPTVTRIVTDLPTYRQSSQATLTAVTPIPIL